MTGLLFPPGFLRSAATAVHQVEGNNDHSDWWDWEQRPGTRCRDRSGIASFEIEHWDDREEDTTTALGEPHHFHLVELVARRTAGRRGPEPDP